MNDFWVHQSIQKANVQIEQLREYLVDLKEITRGDLAKKAAEELTKTSLDVRGQFYQMREDTAVLCSELRGSISLLDNKIKLLRLTIGLSFILISLGIGVLCFVAFRAR